MVSPWYDTDPSLFPGGKFSYQTLLQARYFSWLEAQLQGGAKLSESQAADQLEHYRKWEIFYKTSAGILRPI
jgi:hypothetical protein